MPLPYTIPSRSLHYSYPTRQPRAPWAPAIHLFDRDAVQRQRSRPLDLMLLCTELMVVVKAAWPSIGGHKLPSDHVLAFLLSQGLKWSCFCTLLAEQAAQPSPFTYDAKEIISSLVIHDSQRNVVVCGHSPARCAFFSLTTCLPPVDLDAIHDATRVVAEFDFPMARELGSDPHSIFYTWMMAGSDIDTADLPGYYGEYERGQQKGTRACIYLPAVPSQGNAHPPTPKYKEAGVQVDPTSFVRPAGPFQDLPEALLLATFARGGGVPRETFKNVLATCAAALQHSPSPSPSPSPPPPPPPAQSAHRQLRSMKMRRAESTKKK
ncbi:hypothetical protein DFH09DRAFT_1067150 [Mycena vulgaris]|nr:hypothetical protein DFH09DRAFT_1067150 [Mycena vulgaris]